MQARLPAILALRTMLLAAVLAAAVSTADERKARSQTSHKFGYQPTKTKVHRNHKQDVDEKLDIGEHVWTIFRNDSVARADQ